MTHQDRITRIQDEIRGVVAQYGVTSWERKFLDDIKRWPSITERQEAILAKIEAKVFEEGDEDA